MIRSPHLDRKSWVAIGFINLLHYAVLALLASLGLLLLLAFLTHDADHVRIRARIDHIYEVWAAPHGAAERKLTQSDSLASENSK